MNTPLMTMWRAVGLIFLSGAIVYGATLTGTVKDPGGLPLKAVFVQARSNNGRKVVSALTDRQGQYRLAELGAGDYEIRVRAPGYKSDPRSGVKLAADDKETIDFALQKASLRWSDLSIYEGTKLLPEGKGKDTLTGACFSCHGFQSREAPRRQDESYWQRDVGMMMDRFGYFTRRFVNDQKAAEVVSYLTKTFGPDSELPPSPADMPQYKEVKYPKSLSDDVSKLVYVDYATAGSGRFPGAGRPDDDGRIWIWQYIGNRIAMFDPKTETMKEWPVPYTGQASIHSVVMGPDGVVWFSDQAQNKIGKLDPKTGKIVAYDAPPQHPELEGMERGSKHTLAIDLTGNVWSTGGPLAKFDPKTEKFTNYNDTLNPYGVAVDKDNNVWFSEFAKGGKIGKVDAKTGKLVKFAPPTADSYPRRLKIDSQGMVWFNEYRGGKIGRFDPKTQTFKEFSLPGPSPTPYALAIDKKGHVWYSSMDEDVIGQLNPDNGEVIEYPFPYAENGIRDFFPDKEGRMWWGSQPNDRVGYFIPVDGKGTVPSGREQQGQSGVLRAE